MRLHRFIGEFNLTSEHLIIDDAELVAQLAKVLRLKEGDGVILCDGRGYEAKASIRSIRPMSVSFHLEKKKRVLADSQREVTLYCSILKRENFELVVQKATEIGIKTIVPILSTRTVKQDINPKRLTKIIKEASEQSGRGSLPKLVAPLSFTEAVEQGRACEEQLFFHLEGGELKERKRKTGTCALYIGPEGGWDDTEIALAIKSGFTIVSLGSLTLRAETAAIVGAYLATNQ